MQSNKYINKRSSTCYMVYMLLSIFGRIISGIRIRFWLSKTISYGLANIYVTYVQDNKPLRIK